MIKVVGSSRNAHPIITKFFQSLIKSLLVPIMLSHTFYIGKRPFDPCLKVISILSAVLSYIIYITLYITVYIGHFGLLPSLGTCSPVPPLLRHCTARSCGRWRPGEVCVLGGSPLVRCYPPSLGRTQILGLLAAWWCSRPSHPVAPVSEKELYDEHSLFIISYIPVVYKVLAYKFPGFWALGFSAILSTETSPLVLWDLLLLD